MEIISKKPKRGRPAKFPDDMYAPPPAGQRLPSKRQMQNHFYAGQAINSLTFFAEMDPSLNFQYLIGPPLRPTILAELGRCESLAVLGLPTCLPLAVEICQRRMTTPEAIRLIRHHRVKPKKSSFRSLIHSIERAIQQTLKRHPDLTDDDVNTALCSFREIYQAQVI
jgi:hypothetical protein